MVIIYTNPTINCNFLNTNLKRFVLIYYRYTLQKFVSSGNYHIFLLSSCRVTQRNGDRDYDSKSFR